MTLKIRMKRQKLNIHTKNNNKFKYMKSYLKIFQIFFITIFFLSCKQNNEIKKDVALKKIEIKKINEKKDSDTLIQTITKKNNEEVNDHDEFISASLFEKWKGKYNLKQENLTDGWGRESIFFSEILLIKPDSCVFKSWLADEDGLRYKKDDNYQEYVGGIYATANKDSIEFYTKRVVSGGNNSLSPLLTLIRSNEDYFIYSLITSPPNNGIVRISIKKL